MESGIPNGCGAGHKGVKIAFGREGRGNVPKVLDRATGWSPVREFGCPVAFPLSLAVNIGQKLNSEREPFTVKKVATLLCGNG